MLEYHAAYYEIEDGWFMAKVLDFPGAVSQGRTLRSARRMLRDALQGLAEWLVERGEPLPKPNPRAQDKKAKFLETIPLKIRALTGAIDETATASAASSNARLHHRGGRRKAYHRVQPSQQSPKPSSPASRDQAVPCANDL